jgi:phage terminase Nu1 subunit (DNA packaging protein)
MIMEEIYLLTKHGRFSSEYIEKIPVFKRRYFLNLMKEEADQIKKEQEKSTTHVNRVSGIRKR